MYDKTETLERLRLQYAWQVNNLALEHARKEILAISSQIDQLTGEGALFIGCFYEILLFIIYSRISAKARAITEV